MQDRDLYARILGLVDPWEVRDVKLDVAGGEVRVTVAAKSGAQMSCPECGKACPGYDVRERSWRHLDTCQFKTILVADVARVSCAEHGVKQVRLPRVKRTACGFHGFRNRERFRNAILFHLGGLDLYPEHASATHTDS